MKKLILLVLLFTSAAVVFLPVSPVRADTPMEKVLSELKRQRAAARGDYLDLLLGAGDAFQTTNVKLKRSRGVAPFYCQPGNLQFDALHYADIAITEFERNGSYYVDSVIWNRYPLNGLVDALFEGLKQTFPCPR